METSNLQDTTENTLIVTIKQTADAGEAANQEHTPVPEKCLRASLAGQRHTLLKRSIAELRVLTPLLCCSVNHVADLSLQRKIFEKLRNQDKSNNETTVTLYIREFWWFSLAVLRLQANSKSWSNTDGAHGRCRLPARSCAPSAMPLGKVKIS